MDEEPVVLSELQIDLLRVLWQRGAATTAEVTEALAGSRDLAHTTVATMLGRLEKRGVLEVSREARQLVYRPRVSEAQVRRSMVSGLLGKLFGGDARALVAHLVQADELGQDDLEAVRRLLEEPRR